MSEALSLCREPVKGFRCGERIGAFDEELGYAPVIFQCNYSLPFPSANELSSSETSTTPRVLEFQSREPACGPLLPGEDTVKVDLNDQQDNFVDPNFFDAGYTLAGRTGFQIWTGTRLMIEALAWQCKETDSIQLQDIQEKIRGSNIVELGSGVGVVGTYLSAACYTNTLVTDLPTLVENSLVPNLGRNKACLQETTPAPAWLQGLSCDPIRVHSKAGWISAATLDWQSPLHDQLSPTRLETIDFIIASDCVFLVSMLTSLLDTAASIWNASRNKPQLLLSFQRRDAKDGDRSQSFTTVQRVRSEAEARGWVVQCLAWNLVWTKEEGKTEVYLFSCRKASSRGQNQNFTMS